MTGLTILQPAGWPAPRGYSYGVMGTGHVVMVGGQVGWDEHGRFAEGFVAQAAQTLRNILAIVQEAGGRAEDIARLTWYVVDVEEYRACMPELGAVYTGLFGRWYPAMALVQVGALVERKARLEIEATAILRSPPA